MEFTENMNFGFVPTKMDGTEWIFSSPGDIKIPAKYNYRPYLPNVINQEALSICVPCAVSAYLNWKENLKDGVSRDNKIALMDIYDCKTNISEGMTYKEALQFLRHHGVRSDAGLLKINSYGRLKNQIDMMYAIVMNGPVLAAVPVYSSDCDFWKKKAGQRLLGYHAISVCGYDEDGFIIRNSWGRDFCDEGYTHLDVEDFNSSVLEAWTIID